MKKKTILASLTSIALCASVATGATYALFTSNDTVNIAVTAGKVQVSASLSKAESDWVYSPTSISTAEKNPVVDATNAANVEEGVFANGGTAVLDEDSLTLTNITPGDKVSVNVNITNYSNVAVKYQTVVSIVENSDTGLFDGLLVTVDGETFDGTDIESKWTTLTPDVTDVATVPVVVELPTYADDTYEDKSVTIDFRVHAVQGNAETTDPINYDNVATDEDLAAAIEAKQDFTVTGGTFNKVVKADGTNVTINGGKFNNQIIAARNGANVTVKDASGSTGSSGQAVIANVTGSSTVIIEGGNYPLFNSLLSGDGTGSVIISGGYFDGGTFWWNMGEEPVSSLTITGGTFGSNFMDMHFMMGPSLSEFVPDTHEIINNADGSCTVVAK